MGKIRTKCFTHLPCTIKFLKVQKLYKVKRVPSTNKLAGSNPAMHRVDSLLCFELPIVISLLFYEVMKVASIAEKIHNPEADFIFL